MNDRKKQRIATAQRYLTRKENEMNTLKSSDKVTDEFQVHMERMAVKNTNEWFDQNIKVLERRVEELKAYKMRFNCAATEYGVTDQFTTPANVLSWAVNSLVQITNNLRIDMAVLYGVELGINFNRRNSK